MIWPQKPRKDKAGNPVPPWGCGRANGMSREGDYLMCEWGNLCPDCRPKLRDGGTTR